MSQVIKGEVSDEEIEMSDDEMEEYADSEEEDDKEIHEAKSKYSAKMLKLKDNIQKLADKKANILKFIKSTEDAKKGATDKSSKKRASDQLAKARKERKDLTNKIIGMKGALNSFRVLAKKERMNKKK